MQDQGLRTPDLQRRLAAPAQVGGDQAVCRGAALEPPAPCPHPCLCARGAIAVPAARPHAHLRGLTEAVEDSRVRPLRHDRRCPGPLDRWRDERRPGAGHTGCH